MFLRPSLPGRWVRYWEVPPICISRLRKLNIESLLFQMLTMDSKDTTAKHPDCGICMRSESLDSGLILAAEAGHNTCVGCCIIGQQTNVVVSNETNEDVRMYT